MRLLLIETTLPKKSPILEPVFGSRWTFIENATSAAVSGDPSENLMPFLIVYTYRVGEVAFQLWTTAPSPVVGCPNVPGASM